MSITKRLRYARAGYWRYKRLLFASPAEVRFVELMGGRVINMPRVRLAAGGPSLTIIVSLGRTLKRHRFRREVRIGRYYCDFANDLNWIIEIDGRNYHDILSDQERDDYIMNWCYINAPKQAMEARILRIPATKVFNSGRQTQQQVLSFLNR